ncbi:MAG: isoprenyl transferase [Armatimonadota bacterium]|nr:isoprenyl transferase [Armatimonadota bacterium]MDR7402762.1 isoprenyl transferase [Armatimonadota bacterium]MDR7405133.1 isoprenyl transferase [Armatimonadota bacterium]MDR7437023.1 isoprenyl transferase [Armatimonadota bacterium]MDR7472906.1 isoprenyl transferase [Armatimonadota bacterium]
MSRPDVRPSGVLLDPDRMPAHVAIIMDGNGRWAASRGLPRVAGHRAGLEAARRTVDACRDLGVRVLTLYAFSTENWRRPAEEVTALMALLAEAVREEASDLLRAGVQLRVSGDLQSLDPALRDQIADVVERTRENGALVLNVAYNYGGRAEIVTALRRVAADVARGALRPEAIDEALVDRYLYTAGLPDPDLLIRTGGEQRVSNFLLWQIAYTELYFCDVYWPDFSRSHLEAAIAEYQQRRRRFGGVEDSLGG